MRIAIVTLPLHTNYGGLLQAYALKTVLESMGHEATVLDRKVKMPLPPCLKQYHFFDFFLCIDVKLVTVFMAINRIHDFSPDLFFICQTMFYCAAIQFLHNGDHLFAGD